jgi:hypothetical protein
MTTLTPFRQNDDTDPISPISPSKIHRRSRDARRSSTRANRWARPMRASSGASSTSIGCACRSGRGPPFAPLSVDIRVACSSRDTTCRRYAHCASRASVSIPTHTTGHATCCKSRPPITGGKPKRDGGLPPIVSAHAVPRQAGLADARRSGLRRRDPRRRRSADASVSRRSCRDQVANDVGHPTVALARRRSVHRHSSHAPSKVLRHW